MSTDFYCSRSSCEHDRAWHEQNDPTYLRDFPGDDCETCEWEFCLGGSAGQCCAVIAEKCPECKVGNVVKYGKPHISPERLRLTRALTAQAWAVTCVLLERATHADFDPDGSVWLCDQDQSHAAHFGLAALHAPVELAAEILGSPSP